jgi:hypothetical protein
MISFTFPDRAPRPFPYSTSSREPAPIQNAADALLGIGKIVLLFLEEYQQSSRKRTQSLNAVAMALTSLSSSAERMVRAVEDSNQLARNSTHAAD